MDIRPPPSHPSPVADREIDVWIVEDNEPFRDNVFELLERSPGMRCSLAAGSCEEAVVALQRGQVPQVVLMDLELPGMSGIEGIGHFKTMSPASRIVVLTVHEDDDRIFHALCAGASGYLLKPGSGEKIIEAIEQATDGGAPMNAFVARRVLDMFTRYAHPRGDYKLTPREREILELLVEAYSQKQIAAKLSLSPHTIDTHLRNIYAKLHVHSQQGAVAKALKERLL